MALILILNDRVMGPFIVGAAESGYQVLEVQTSGDALQAVMKRQPDVVVIPDEGEPIEGVELLPVLRRMTGAAIVVVGEGGETKVAQAFFQGADAYIKRPYGIREVRSRLRALLRPKVAERRSAKDSGPTLLQAISRKLTKSVVSELSTVEKRLLGALLSHGGSTVQAQQLVADVWGPRGSRTSLRTYIRRLREKLESRGGLRIWSQSGIGYRLELQPALSGA